MLLPGTDPYFMDMSALVCLKVATKKDFGGNEALNTKILMFFKKDKCDQKNRSFFY